MNKHLVSIILAASVYAMPGQIKAQVVPTGVSADQHCSPEVLLSHFPEVFVRQTLQKFNVPEDKWEGIVKELNEKNKTVATAVEGKASKMGQNPLSDPQQRQAAVKLFRETILEVFSSVMKNNGITDDNQIQAMLDDIQQQTAKRFAECIKRAQTTAATELKKGDDDEDEGDFSGSK